MTRLDFRGPTMKKTIVPGTRVRAKESADIAEYRKKIRENTAKDWFWDQG
ncbi:hypothetical protein DSCA_43510 [Desulfosarcina alkanivorans]|jgi:hypothetical protein|uniref:Uncharacterized protein n=1 Tax=Desulfosarcina alkanivorans TaxID=571177 RepID=A0A5K7YTR0_9BACT|nr:hypothetical protein DSCA_43510 [Desulfosarcina alkanivorans]